MQTVLAQPVQPLVAEIMPEGEVPGSPAPSSTEDSHVLTLNAPWVDFTGTRLPQIDKDAQILEEPIGGYLEIRFKPASLCGHTQTRIWAPHPPVPAGVLHAACKL